MVPPHRGLVCRNQNAKTQICQCNALASLPKQVLRNILDTLDVCSDSDEPFDFLKNTLLGQFGKSKWQSYFELLHLPMEMQGLKPSVLMGKVKQNLSRSITRQRSFSCNVFDAPSAIHERDSRSWPPWNGRSHGEGCGCPMGRSGQPRPYGPGPLDTAKQEPCSQQRQEKRQKGQ